MWVYSVLYEVEFVPIWNDSLYQCSTPYNFSYFICSTTKFHMRNKQQETVLHTTNREYHHQLIWYWTWLCISIQQWNRKNSLEKIQIPAIKKQQRHQQPFRLSFLDWEVCKNTSYCFLSIRIYAHITYTYCMEMRPFMLNQRMWSVPHCRSKG